MFSTNWGWGKGCPSLLTTWPKKLGVAHLISFASTFFGYYYGYY